MNITHSFVKDHFMKTKLYLLLKVFLIIILFSCETSFSKKSNKPNFVIFIADDISWDDLGCYGNKFVKTPNIDKLSSEGIMFSNMYLTTSSCSPSRNSIMTGRYPHNTGAPELHSEPPLDMISLAEELKNSGYFTVSSGKFHMGDYVRKGFDLIYEDKKINGLGGEDKWVSTIVNRPKNKPFFLWYASYDAHRTWGENEFYGTHKEENLTPPEYLINDSATKKDLADYYDEIKRFDNYVGEVVKTLKNQKVYENTLIIIMADNGRPFPHSKTRLNDQGVKTPFILVYKNDNISGETESLVSSIDIAPMILDFAGLKIGENYQGKSFRGLLENPKNSFRNFVFAEHNWHDFESHERMIRSKDFMFIENNRNQFAQRGPLDAINSDSYASLLKALESGDISEIQKDIFISPRAKEEFYEIKKDPYQRINLIDDQKFQEKIETLKSVLNIWKLETGDTQPIEITKDWYERKPGPKYEKSNLKKDKIIGGPNSLKTEFYGKREEFPGASKNASRINNKGPF